MSSPVYRHSPRTRRILWVLAPIACPPEIIARDLLEPTIDALEDFMGKMPPGIQVATVVGLEVFEATAALYPPNMGRPFSALDGDRARQWFEIWWHSPVSLMREFAKKTKGLLAFCYYEHPAVRAELVYHPDRWIKHVAQRRVERYGEEIRKKEAEVTAPDPLTSAMLASTAGQRITDTTPQPEPAMAVQEVTR